MKKGGGKKKGSLFELNIAKEIANACGLAYGTDIRRTPASGALTTRADLWVCHKVRSKFPYFVECKNRQSWTFDNMLSQGEKWLPYVWLMEAESKLPVDPEYEKDSPVILIFTKNHCPVFTMSRQKLEPFTNFNVLMDYPELGVYIQDWDTFLENASADTRSVK